MKRVTFATIFAAAVLLFVAAAPNASAGGDYPYQMNFNYVTDHIMATASPWAVHVGTGAVILDDGSLGTGPLDPKIQQLRLIDKTLLINWPYNKGVRRQKDFLGKRSMRFAGKEFVDKGFGWKQVSGPGAGKDIFDKTGWVRPYSEEDDILEDIWNGDRGAVGDYLNWADGVDGPPIGGTSGLGQIRYPNPSGQPITTTDRRRVQDLIQQYRRPGAQPNGQDVAVGAGVFGATQDVNHDFKIGGDQGHKFQHEDNRYVVRMTIKYNY